jgi:ketosteroid isomerase-like protein
MSDETRINSFFQAMSAQDTKALEDGLAEEAVFRFPKTEDLVGRDKILKFFRLLFRRYPRLNFEVRTILRDGDRAAAHWTNQGRGRKGEDYANEGVTWMEWRDGKLAFISDFFKNTEAF